MFSKKTMGSGNALHGVGDRGLYVVGEGGGELPEDVHCISGGEYNTYCTIQYDTQYVLVHVASGGCLMKVRNSNILANSKPSSERILVVWTWD